MNRRNMVLSFTFGMALAVPGWSQICRPAAIPSNPSPVRSPQALSQNSECRFRVMREMRRNEDQKQTLTLEKGKSYWFAANGCPKMGVIRITVEDENGKVLKEASKYDPSFCFTPAETGRYVVRATAMSLMGAHVSGTVSACLSDSGCR